MFLFFVSVQCVLCPCVCGHAGNAAERHTVIEPVPEAVEAILYKVFGCSEVEPGINCTLGLANCSISKLVAGTDTRE